MSATVSQCSHWRDMRPRREAVIAFVAKWVYECGCWPGHPDVGRVFEVDMREARSLLWQARVVLESVRIIDDMDTWRSKKNMQEAKAAMEREA